nr:MAG TPA: hypothetical protein [Caudoviricetes sp.]
MTLILIIYYMCEIAKWRSRYLITFKKLRRKCHGIKNS